MALDLQRELQLGDATGSPENTIDREKAVWFQWSVAGSS